MAPMPHTASLDARSTRDLSGILIPIIALLLSAAAGLAVIVPMVGEVGWTVIGVPFLLVAYLVVVVRRAARYRASRRRLR